MRRTNTAVWHEKHKRWQINVQKDGNRRSFYSSETGKVGQRACNSKADAWLDEGLIKPNTKVQVLFDNWIEELKVTTCKDHWRQYEGYGKNWIFKKIGKSKIGSLTEQQLQSVITDAYKSRLSKKTLNNIKSCMTAFVKYGRKCKATTLFVENLKIPREAKSGERTILQPEDIEKLFTVENTILHGKEVYEQYINAYRFEVATGLRPGEVIGLKWSDISNDKIFIRRSVNRYGEETSGKNENARRSFAIIPLASYILKMQKEKLKFIGISSKEDIIFPNEYGEHIKQATYYNRWVRYRDHAGISEASPYELRHTFVSIVKQLPEGLLKPLVGHSKDMDTYGTYSHEINGEMEKTAVLVQSLFSKVLK